MTDDLVQIIKEGFEQVEARFEQIDARFERIDARFEQVDTRLDTLDRHMHVLHEDTLIRSAAFSEEPVATKREMDRGFAELKDLILGRIEPLEVAVRGLLQERRPGQS